MDWRGCTSCVCLVISQIVMRVPFNRFITSCELFGYKVSMNFFSTPSDHEWCDPQYLLRCSVPLEWHKALHVCLNDALDMTKDIIHAWGAWFPRLLLIYSVSPAVFEHIALHTHLLQWHGIRAMHCHDLLMVSYVTFTWRNLMTLYNSTFVHVCSRLGHLYTALWCHYQQTACSDGNRFDQIMLCSCIVYSNQLHLLLPWMFVLFSSYLLKHPHIYGLMQSCPLLYSLGMVTKRGLLQEFKNPLLNRLM